MSSSSEALLNRRSWLVPGALRGRLLRLLLSLPAAAMLVGAVGLTLYCRSLLQAAAAGRPVPMDDLPLFAAVGGFLLASAGVVVVQSIRLSNRVAGPELRLQRALQRIRGGDVAFRITLRRGDLLTGLAAECNELLDWLNQNPPKGARTGGDIVEVPEQSLEQVAP